MFSKMLFRFLIFVFVTMQCGNSYFLRDPPPFFEKAKMARYVVHNVDWASVGTISRMKGIEGYPFVGLKSVSDGPDTKATGIPYLMMTNMDVSMQDLLANNKCTLFFSLAESDYCRKQDWDPQDPRCARVMLTGSIKQLKNNSEEYKFAEETLFARHPDMRTWPQDHNFFIAKMDIMQICVLDFFGGISLVSVEDYMKADMSDYTSNITKRYSSYPEVILLDQQ